MSDFQQLATVDADGQIVLNELPFAPGTEVEITITTKEFSSDNFAGQEDDGLAAARAKMRDLFRTTKGFRNSPRITREELYGRERIS
ncbi:hypothetical protein BH10PLA2_BH10PLA2_07970 [soil metagenome]